MADLYEALQSYNSVDLQLSHVTLVLCIVGHDDVTAAAAAQVRQ